VEGNVARKDTGCPARLPMIGGCDSVSGSCRCHEAAFTNARLVSAGAWLVAKTGLSPRLGGGAAYSKGVPAVLWTILAVLLVLWLLGFIGNVAGGFIHLLLVLALIVFVVNALSNRRTV
jgi:hypothetical protein